MFRVEITGAKEDLSQGGISLFGEQFWSFVKKGPMVTAMAKPNYQFEKRRREIEKKAKKAEKAEKRKQEAENPTAPEAEGEAPAEQVQEQA